MSGPATGETRYIVANDDQSGIVREGVSFYPVSSDGLLTRKKEVSTGGFGISGGYFGTDRIRTLNSGSQGCVYSSSGAAVNNPFSISSQNGVLSAQFVMAHSVENNGYTHYCYKYTPSGQVVESPTLRVNPGQKKVVVLLRERKRGAGQYHSVESADGFRDPTIAGTFVFHCHILLHEDLGMVHKVLVEP